MHRVGWHIRSNHRVVLYIHIHIQKYPLCQAALIHSLHNDPSYGLSFIENFKAFRDDLELTEDWQRELAIREAYKMPFVWGYCEALDDHADPEPSPEYYKNCEWCEEIEDYID